MSFADDASDAVDSTFHAFGVPATYTPPDGPPAVNCYVILKSADRQVAFGEGRAFAEGDTICVRASEVASPVAGGVFVPGAGSFEAGTFVAGMRSLKIIGDPEARDEMRLVWDCRVAQ